MHRTAMYLHSNAFKTGLMLLFAASLILGVLAGELTLIRLESSAL